MRSARAVFVLVPFLLSAYALYSITFVLGDLATALHTTIEGITLAVTLSWVGGAVGGLAFGVLADRWSRKGALLIAILLFSVATTLTYLVRDLPELYALWFLVGFGVNGENGISYVILAEASFTSLRGLNGGLVQGTYDLGVLLGALTASLVGGWREVFLVAGLAGLLGVPFWVGVESTHRRSKRVPLTSIFRGGLLRLTVVGSALSLSSLLLVVALFSLAPTILSTERGYYSAIVVGALLSTVAYALAGYASDLWGGGGWR
ncbi:hypothetical protein HS1genome_0391 [Sulfodiicoccus acidiphilus]|uniref:Major facilitator superfamily (MFS) profile domain-containing protein n=1 Tax=Sulfodiicoccus acidiphilus TaxID=1670455 RepID=A0A348B1F0_9CREN|nr:MFS transporter [Sulfodiicoccus acidiphilus]BBD72002.1 hypothetical protein HS1genome_0391 [Sulfodiicoccus acidiphilus]